MRQTCLISYDICAPKRLRRLHRALSKIAVPIQYSLFLGVFTREELARLRALIEEIIDPRKDDVRIYPLPRNGWVRRLGRAILPQGITLTMLPESFRNPTRAELSQAKLPSARPGPVALGQARGRAARAITARVQTGQRRGITLV